MKLLSLAIAGLLAATALPAHALAVGDDAPVFSLAGPAGDVSLASARGKVVYLDFWASWCAPCRKSFPWMAAMQRKYGDKGFTVIAVNVDANADDVRRFLADSPAQFPLAFDPKGATPRSYAVKGMPSSVLIGADGKVIGQHAGFRDEDAGVLEDRIRQALAARP